MNQFYLYFFFSILFSSSFIFLEFFFSFSSQDTTNDLKRPEKEKWFRSKFPDLCDCVCMYACTYVLDSKN